MKSRILLLTLLVWAGIVSAQTFNKTIKKSNLLVFENITSISNGKIIFSGYSNDSILTTKAIFQIGLLDSTGNLEFLKTYSDTALSLFSATNGIIAENDSIINLLIATGNGNANRPAIIITDFLGNELLRKFYLNSNYWYETPNAIIKTTNAYYLTGTFQRFNGDADVMLMKLSNDFEVLWKKEFGDNNKTEIGYSIIELSNGNLLIGAHRTDAGMTVAGKRYKEQTWIFEIDTAGNMVREFLDTNTRTGPAKGLTKTQDGGFVYGSTYQYLWDGVFDYTYRAYLGKINNNLNNKDWEYIFKNDLKGNERINHIIEHNNGEFIGVGRKYADINEIKPENEIPGFLTKFNSNGNILWNKYYVGLDSSDEVYFNELYHVAADNENNLIACGEAYRFSSPKQGWLLKLDENGCLNKDECGEALSIEQKVLKSSDFQIYPNPVKETLFINTQENIEALKIYNTLGQLVVEQKFPPTQVNLSGLKSGLYFMKVKTAKGVITKKFVKE